MRKELSVVFIVLLLLLISTKTFATNGHQLSAIGAYQQGMAGAVTAAPYDASTAITNPAGMAMIGSRTDFSFEGFFPKRRLEFGFGGGITEGGSGFYLVPAIGWTAPVDAQGELYFGGGMYGVSGMGVDYDVVPAPVVASMMGWSGGAEAHIWSQYQFWKMAPTLAWTNGKLAVGFALNMDYQAFGFKNMFTEVGGSGKMGMDLGQMQGAVGVGGTLGIIYRPAPSFAAGLSYASKQYFSDFKWRLAAGDVSNVYDPAGNPVSSQNGTYTMSLDFPQQAAFGIAVRPVRPVLWTADVKWINYHDTYNVVKLKGDFTGPYGSADEVELNFGWENVMVYATALQVDVTPKLALRAGFNYSSSPIKAEDVDNNVAFPAIVKRRASGGFTYRLGRNWEMTMAFMKAFKEELSSGSGSGTKISLEETAGDIELSYRF